jgi:hypothetical protein
VLLCAFVSLWFKKTERSEDKKLISHSTLRTAYQNPKLKKASASQNPLAPADITRL